MRAVSGRLLYVLLGVVITALMFSVTYSFIDRAIIRAFEHGCNISKARANSDVDCYELTEIFRSTFKSMSFKRRQL